ncbi:tRNA-specific 2-thiouridylase MnmA [hydrothermal vent metagenome]|uniref:tRNA-specific 2-thiouridylase MnmA n=1 Tax=hydrothermal vent metagenome TaxID=652676 RepID=A0A3B1B963_9ZZZZ
MKTGKVLAAMSGGVDSSAATALLKKEGHEIIGVTMRVWEDPVGTEKRHGACCALDDADDARRVADRLDIPHYVLNVKKEFKEQVVDKFVNEYVSGRTPNPCVLCNGIIKFDYLFRQGEKYGAKYVATGHYAQTGSFRDFPVIMRGVDRNKDQSYFLFSIKPENVGRILFPLGALEKSETRKIAHSFDLNVAEKAESQEICFIPDNNYANLIKSSFNTGAGVTAGEIINGDGIVIGQHKGYAHYTIGQRRGLGIANATPLYVTAIEPETNRVIVGQKSDVYGKTLQASSMNWFVPPQEICDLTLTARIRHNHDDSVADVKALGNNEAVIEFKTPQLAIAPGQAIVIYHENVVVGGGWIEKRIA